MLRNNWAGEAIRATVLGGRIDGGVPGVTPPELWQGGHKGICNYMLCPVCVDGMLCAGGKCLVFSSPPSLCVGTQ